MQSISRVRSLAFGIAVTAIVVWLAQANYAQREVVPPIEKAQAPIRKPEPIHQLDVIPPRDLSLIDDTEVTQQEPHAGTTYVIVDKLGTSRLLLGDTRSRHYAQPDENLKDVARGPVWQTSVLPALLSDGWRVVSEVPIDDACLIRLEK